MKTFFCTFGFNQTLKNCYVRIEAEDKQAAHKQMSAIYGNCWAFCYDEAEYESAIKRWNLTEVPFGTPNTKNTDK